MANTPGESWYGRQEPTENQIRDTWQALFVKAADEAERWLPPKSPEQRFLSRSSAMDLHVSITTAKELEEETENQLSDHVIEMPSFAQPEQDADEKEWEPEEGGLALVDSGIDMDERSVLLLHMEIRQLRNKLLTAGIVHHRYDSLIIPSNLGMKAVCGLQDLHRRRMADILLYQLAQDILMNGSDDEDRWMDLQTIIDTHLDMPNVRAFHRAVSGS